MVLYVVGFVVVWWYGSELVWVFEYDDLYVVEWFIFVVLCLL